MAGIRQIALGSRRVGLNPQGSRLRCRGTQAGGRGNRCQGQILSTGRDDGRYGHPHRASRAKARRHADHTQSTSASTIRSVPAIRKRTKAPPEKTYRYGLAAEREQGITIDVAYRFFATDRRKFIVADTPGHEQYTRNMVTGASTAELRGHPGRCPQGRAHADPAAQLSRLAAGHRHDRARDQQDGPGRLLGAAIRGCRAMPTGNSQPRIGLTDMSHPGVGAARRQHHRGRRQHAVVSRADRCCSTSRASRSTDDVGTKPFRMPVQWVNRPNLDFRGFAGTRRRRQRARPAITVAYRPSGHQPRSRASSPRTVICSEAVAGQSVTLTLTDEIDISRGDLLAAAACPAGRRRSVRGDHRLDERRADAARPAIPAQCGARTVTARDRTAQVQGQRQHAGARGRGQLELNEIGSANLESRPAARLRSVYAKIATPAASS